MNGSRVTRYTLGAQLPCTTGWLDLGDVVMTEFGNIGVVVDLSDGVRVVYFGQTGALDDEVHVLNCPTVHVMNVQPAKEKETQP